MLSLLLGRLMQVQLFQTEHFSKHHVNLIGESVKQRTHELVLDDGRGQFLDRHGKPLSYEEKTVLVLFPFIKELDWKSEQVAQILGLTVHDLHKDLRHAKEPFVFGEKDPFILTEEQTKKINDLAIPGVYAVKKKYPSSERLATQLIGIYGENEHLFKKRYPHEDWRNKKLGLTGLQSTFDEFLLPENESKLIYHVDGIGDPLFGIHVKYTGQGNPFFPLQVKTTVDRSYQEIIERLLDAYEVKKGGAVLLDIQTNDLLAIASRPHINVQQPFSNVGTKNMMFEQLIPGSVFKTVVAGAAIEEGLINENDQFDCDLNIRGEQAKRKLGQLDFETSFSRSCNRTFAELAVTLMEENPQLLEQYAQKLGLLTSISWTGQLFQLKQFRQFDHDQGRIFIDEESRKDRNFVSQTGIGQHEVRTAPISVANMMATIARGGKKLNVRAATDILYGDGTTMAQFPKQKRSEAEVTPYTAMMLQQLLRKVVTDSEGTGAIFRHTPYTVAGKSGTAQTALEKDDQKLYHKWFAGYFPFDHPQYALVVVNVDVPEDEGGVNQLFVEIVTEIFKKNDQNNDTFNLLE